MNRFRVSSVAAILALVAGTVACSSVDVSSQRYMGTPVFAPTRPEAVEILRKAPPRPHEKLGEVIISPSGNPPVPEMEAALRVEAAKMGADAAVLVYDKTKRVGRIVEGPWWDRRAFPVYGRKIVAVAIKYKG